MASAGTDHIVAAEPETYYLEETSFVPNSKFPVLVYRDALPRPYSEETTQNFLEGNNWLKGVRANSSSTLTMLIALALMRPLTHRGHGALFQDITFIPILTNATVRLRDISCRAHLTKQAVFQGASTLLLGAGPYDDAGKGQEVVMKAGDVIVLPAGVSHCSKDFRDDYRYVGVYPKGSPKWKNEYCKDASRRQELRAESEGVDAPVWDPVRGYMGPLHNLWA